MKNIEVIEMNVRPSAYPPASFGVCMAEAITLAATEWRNVRLVYGGSEYLILANDLIATCKKVAKTEGAP